MSYYAKNKIIKNIIFNYYYFSNILASSPFSIQTFWLHPLCPLFLFGCKIKFNLILLPYNCWLQSTICLISTNLHLGENLPNLSRLPTDYHPQSGCISMTAYVPKIWDQANRSSWFSKLNTLEEFELIRIKIYLICT